jgi:hypothetical protein
MPDQNYDMTYRQGLRVKGFNFTTAIGTITQELSLSGLAKSFEGIFITNANAATIVTLIVNNDVVIDSQSATQLGLVTSGFPAFVPFPRRLTGQDTIQLRVVDTAARAINVAIYYRNEI